MRKSLIFIASALLAVACAQTGEENSESEQDPAQPVLAEQSAQPSRDRPMEPQRQSTEKREQMADALFFHKAPASIAGGRIGSPDPLGAARYAPFVTDRENYAQFDDNGVFRVAERPVSTFSIDVDTGAYANVRRFLREGRLPAQDAVRVEELINYFDYAYAAPRDRATPFGIHAEIAPTPWNAKTHLLRVGLQGWVPSGDLPPSNLVFLVDVSGSMKSADKLDLVKSSMRMLVNELSSRDRVSLVVYAGASGVVLEPTAGDQQATILSALDRLEAGGSTNGAAGIRLAYAMAEQGFIRGGINRVLLATDGDFNVGTVNFGQLKDLVEEKRKSGVALSTLGFGTGNYNDHLMEQLADAGNGNYTYVDGIQEARRALVQSRAATLMTIAKDVKIQIEFNPDNVAEYRLIGYENRMLEREDFNNDLVDAGEIGAGHTVTALYEVALVASGGSRIDPLRYGAGTDPMREGVRESSPATNSELAFLRIRYKAPDRDTSRLIEQPVTVSQMKSSMASASESLRFAAAVAAFGQMLRGGQYTERYSFDDVLALARGARGQDPDGWRGEFLQLVQLAGSLTTRAAAGRGGAHGENCNSERGCG